MGCIHSFGKEDMDIEFNLDIFTQCKNTNPGDIAWMKRELCLSQYGILHLDRKLVWIRLRPGEDFPLIVTPKTCPVYLSKKIIPRILNEFGDDDEIISHAIFPSDEDFWKRTRDGQYLLFDVEYKKCL